MSRRFIFFTVTILIVVIVCWQPPSAKMSPPGCGGTASFTNGPYDWVNSTFYYNVTGAPPNTCGTLYTFRNGSQLISPGWICTNSSGNAIMGPYSGSSNQTDQNIYIDWGGGCTTTGATFHISDSSPPTIWINSYSGTSFTGSASDAQWGTGFDFTIVGWSTIYTTHQNLSTGKFADSSGYNNNNVVFWGGSPSTFVGSSFNWTATPPPSSAHNPSNSYRWCAWTYDLFYQSNIACVGFVGVP